VTVLFGVPGSAGKVDQPVIRGIEGVPDGRGKVLSGPVIDRDSRPGHGEVDPDSDAALTVMRSGTVDPDPALLDAVEVVGKLEGAVFDTSGKDRSQQPSLIDHLQNRHGVHPCGS
jgi:hypothetical protein